MKLFGKQNFARPSFNREDSFKKTRKVSLKYLIDWIRSAYGTWWSQHSSNLLLIRDLRMFCWNVFSKKKVSTFSSGVLAKCFCHFHHLSGQQQIFFVFFSQLVTCKCRSTSAKPADRRSLKQRTSQVHREGSRIVKHSNLLKHLLHHSLINLYLRIRSRYVST